MKTIVAQDGHALTERQVILAAPDLKRSDDRLQVEGDEVVRRFLGLDAS